MSPFGAPGQAEHRVEDRPDGSTVFSTSVWGERDGGRVVRCWTKIERYAAGQLAETEIFDYNERFYERDEALDMLRAAGFAPDAQVRASDGAEPQADDAVVYICRRPAG